MHRPYLQSVVTLSYTTNAVQGGNAIIWVRTGTNISPKAVMDSWYYLRALLTSPFLCLSKLNFQFRRNDTNMLCAYL